MDGQANVGVVVVAYKSTKERKREREEDLLSSCVRTLVLAW